VRAKEFRFYNWHLPKCLQGATCLGPGYPQCVQHPGSVPFKDAGRCPWRPATLLFGCLVYDRGGSSGRRAPRMAAEKRGLAKGKASVSINL